MSSFGIVISIFDIIVSGISKLVILGCFWSNLDLIDQILLRNIMLLLLIFSDLYIDCCLSFLQLRFVTYLTSRQFAIEVKFELLDTDL
jgi:hypothetical protein